MNVALFVLALNVTVSTAFALRGVINDPDGFTNVRARQSTSSKVVATVKHGEVFDFEADEGAQWCKVKLASGKTGWMPASRVRLFYTDKDLPKKGESDDAARAYSQGKGIADYYALVRAAAHADAKAMEQYFDITYADGATGEQLGADEAIVVHLIGDDRFSAFLAAQPIDYRLGVRDLLTEGALVTGPFEPESYLRNAFPKTFARLFRRELTDWPSPDGKYAIHKVFSDEYTQMDSTVTRAELIDKTSGRVLKNFTSDDEGSSGGFVRANGADREGRILWTDDSQRFAAYSCAQFSGHTTVYQIAGDQVQTVALPVNEPPGGDADSELKGAKHIWTFIEPDRWSTPTTLELNRHDYFQSTDKTRPTRDIGRFYHISVAIGADGKATVKDYSEQNLK